MVRTAASAFLLLLCAVPALAFKPAEHCELSTRALAAALETSRASEELEAVALALNRDPEASFGQVTVAVDWFQRPDELLDPATYRAEIRSRHRNLLKRGMAVHRNRSHFQHHALAAWRDHHVEAVRLASVPGKEKDALLHEAVALHYLQDFFSAGHVVTPRAGMHDAAAGLWHDRFNHRGVGFRTATSAERVEFHGDGWLKRVPAQKEFVTAVSTKSIVEVLRASAGESGPELQTCFEARMETRSEGSPVAISGPAGGIRQRPAPADRVLDRCEGDDWQGLYLTRDDADLRKDFYDLSGLTLRGDAGVGRRDGDVRFNTDVLLLVFAEPPPGDIANRPDLASGLNLLAGSAGLTYSRGDDYNAWGLLYDYTLPTAVDGLTWGFKFSVRRYGYGDTHPWRTDLALKGGVGVDVVNVVAVVERAHHVADSGHFRPEYFVTVGAETHVASSWVGSLLRQLRR